MSHISVIIPTYNRADKVIRAVSSVLEQTYRRYEIIVVDDGSSDNTRKVLKPFREKIQYIRLERNSGVSAARNTGISASKAPLIAFLDSDDYWLPEKLSAQAAFFRRHPRAVACQTEEIWIRKGRRVNPRRKHIKPSGRIFVPCLRLCLVSPSAVMLRRALFDEVGGFDEDFPVCEDYDLWLRIACAHPIHLIETPLVVKEGGGADQLSASRKGMDRFRIRAMVNLLESGRLNGPQVRATLDVLCVKCRIYGEGCLKRGKEKEGRYYLDLPGRMRRCASDLQTASRGNC